MKSLQSFIISLGLILAAVAIHPPASYSQQSHKIIIAGYKHDPSIGTSGSGIITVHYQNDTLRVEGKFSDLMGRYWGAYIMVGKKGEYGNMLYRLHVKPNEEQTGGTLSAKKNTFVLNDAAKELLKNGELFINITSSEHTSGELRGQIPPMKS